MSLQHTPTPWGVDGVYVERKGDERLVTLANCSHSPRIDIPTAKANAEFIVRAVNAHDDLLSALAAALEWIDAVPPETVLPTMPGFDRDDVNALLDNLKAAS
jgi:hypothetical protein